MNSLALYDPGVLLLSSFQFESREVIVSLKNAYPVRYITVPGVPPTVTAANPA